jgi:hypothetical protein
MSEFARLGVLTNVMKSDERKYRIDANGITQIFWQAKHEGMLSTLEPLLMPHDSCTDNCSCTADNYFRISHLLPIT